MSRSVGWESAFQRIIDAGLAVREPRPYDVSSRRREVTKRLSEVSKPSLALLVLAAPCLMIPMIGVGVSGLLLAGWGLSYWKSVTARQTLEEELSRETARLERAHEADSVAVAHILQATQLGNPIAFSELLNRWSLARPEEIRSFSAQLTQRGDVWQLLCRAVRRDHLDAFTERAGRRGRPVREKRKAADLDEELVEINASAVLSVLIALFNAPRRAKIAVRVDLDTQTDSGTIPWIALESSIDSHVLEETLGKSSKPSDAVLLLGGGVGRCRAQRYKPAVLPSKPTASSPVTPPHTPVAQLVKEEPAQPLVEVRNRNPFVADATSITAAPVTPPPAAVESARQLQEVRKRNPFIADATSIIAAPVTPVAAIIPAPTRSSFTEIPPAPPSLQVSFPPEPSTPTVKNVVGMFPTVARKFEHYHGDQSARFVAFQSYWPQYSSMAPGQLKFYFKWRGAVREGKAPRADLSYIFVHVYELLHGIGAENSADAGSRLERLWLAYRPVFPALDRYLVTWISDLYSLDVGAERAHEFLRHAVSEGAALRDDENLLIADQYWAKADYVSMPNSLLEVLVRDPRLNDNKFYVAHNKGPDGIGWLDRAYREALGVADTVYKKQHGMLPREAELTRFGKVEVSRESFAGAVYGWNRRPVRLGHVPKLEADGLAAPLYRNSIRFAENLLRTEKGFGAKRRGVEVSGELQNALEVHFGRFVRSTKPRTRVVIDLQRAKDLERESVEIRNRLLEGLDVENGVLGESSPAARSVPDTISPSTTNTSVTLAERRADGLLTDLEAIKSALAGVSPPALAVLRAIMNERWEVSVDARSLQAAAQGALVSPLVDEINERVLDSAKDVLIVHELDQLVVQEDFRDEVYWMLRGSLDGYGTEGVPMATLGVEQPRAENAQMLNSDGFGPTELAALRVLAQVDASCVASLDGIAAKNGTTRLLLIDRINELALTSAFGDLIVDSSMPVPLLFDEASEYVAALLRRSERFLSDSNSAAHSSTDESH